MLPVFRRALSLKHAWGFMHGGIIKGGGGAKASFNRGSKGPMGPRPFSALRYVMSQVAEGVR